MQFFLYISLVLFSRNSSFTVVTLLTHFVFIILYSNFYHKKKEAIKPFQFNFWKLVLSNLFASLGFFFFWLKNMVKFFLICALILIAGDFVWWVQSLIAMKSPTSFKMKFCFCFSTSYGDLSKLTNRISEFASAPNG